MAARKTKSRRQIGLLLSKSSPLTKEQREKLLGELSRGDVRVRKTRSRRRRG